MGGIPRGEPARAVKLRCDMKPQLIQTGTSMLPRAGARRKPSCRWRSPATGR